MDFGTNKTPMEIIKKEQVCKYASLVPYTQYY